MTKRNPFKYVIEDVSRHGTVRVYYREPGNHKIRIWVSREHPRFIDYYQAAKAGRPLPKPSDAPAANKPAEGTLSALVRAYTHSANFKAVNALGQRGRLAILESCCNEIHPPSGRPMGDIPVKYITPQHIQFLQDQKGNLPGAANNRVKYLRILFGWASKGVAQPHNPAKAIAMLKPRKKDGHHSWFLAEVAKYEERHPIGTVARLAADLALYTAARRSDIVKLGPHNLTDEGWLSFVQSKTGRMVELPIVEQLAMSIAATKTGAKTFIVTSFGRPYTSNGFGNAMRQWCDEAGLPNCSVHGLRKATASKLAELGASGEQIKAITGHTTDSEVKRYTAAARRRIMAESAMKLLQDSLHKKSHSE